MPKPINWLFDVGVNPLTDPDKPKTSTTSSAKTSLITGQPLYSLINQGKAPTTYLNSNIMSIYDPTRGLNSNNQSIYYNPGISLFPATPTTTSTAVVPAGGGGYYTGGGGYYTGGGGGGGRKPVKWASTYSVEGAPEWWQGLTPNRVDAESSYLSMVNAMIPYMSPEDQLATLQYFATAFPKGIGETYSPAAQVETGNIPTDMTTSISDFFTSAGRAEEAKAALDTMIEAIATKTKSKSEKVKKNLGEGYKFLTSVLDTIQKFGGVEEGERQTRAQYQQMLGQLDPLLALGQAQQFGAMQPVAQKLVQPFFTAGQVTPTVKVGGVQKFGAPNLKRF